MSDGVPFTRSTIIAAANVMMTFGHSEFDNWIIRFGIDELVQGNNLQTKSNRLSQVALADPGRRVELSTGTSTLAEAIVRAALAVAPRGRSTVHWEALEDSLKRDGFVLVS